MFWNFNRYKNAGNRHRFTVVLVPYTVGSKVVKKIRALNKSDAFKQARKIARVQTKISHKAYKVISVY